MVVILIFLVIIVALSLATYIIFGSVVTAAIVLVVLAIIFGVCYTVIKIINKRKSKSNTN